MTDFVKNAWAFLLASLLFGVWIIPMIIGYVLLVLLIQWIWPDYLNKYM